MPSNPDVPANAARTRDVCGPCDAGYPTSCTCYPAPPVEPSTDTADDHDDYDDFVMPVLERETRELRCVSPERMAELLVAEAALAARTSQTCPRSIHRDWWHDGPNPLPCPWCQLEQRDIELDIANNEIGQMRDGAK